MTNSEGEEDEVPEKDSAVIYNIVDWTSELQKEWLHYILVNYS
jgi:hypothetical protein